MELSSFIYQRIYVRQGELYFNIDGDESHFLKAKITMFTNDSRSITFSYSCWKVDQVPKTTLGPDDEFVLSSNYVRTFTLQDVDITIGELLDEIKSDIQSKLPEGVTITDIVDFIR